MVQERGLHQELISNILAKVRAFLCNRCLHGFESRLTFVPQHIHFMHASYRCCNQPFCLKNLEFVTLSAHSLICLVQHEQRFPDRVYDEIQRVVDHEMQVCCHPRPALS